MAKKILISSLQYSPIYKSHCCALGNQCEKCGYSVKYLLSSEYKWMLDEKMVKKTKFIANSKDILSAVRDGLNYKHRLELKQFIFEFEPDYIYFYNYHPFFNSYIAELARKRGTTFIQHVHEPYYEDKSPYKGKGTKMSWLLLYLFEFLQGRLLEETDIAVLSSKRALYLFNKRYANFRGKKLLIPLIYEDLGSSFFPLDRKYILFVGPPVPSKSPETFLNIIDYSKELGLDLNFLLITRKRIDNDWYLRDNLTIFCKDKISDEEIGRYQKESLMAITPYKVATQSSVVLTSFMHGTPVVSTNVGGLKEVINHLETGYLLSKDSSIEDWLNGIMFIKRNLGYISDNCREYFIENFSEKNWPKYFNELFV
jgi:glycosyltransferase involved in cell wall biosynthesis